MNWINIYHATPKAFNDFYAWGWNLDDQVRKKRFLRAIVEGDFDLEDWQLIVRDLNDFFDSHKIYVRVSPNDALPAQFTAVVLAAYNGQQVSRQVPYATESGSEIIPHPSRQEAETAAFTRAFELLEQQLAPPFPPRL